MPTTACAPPDIPVFLGRDWLGDWRFRRIGALLAARPRHDAAGFAAMQRDTVSLFARELLAAGALLRDIPRPEGAAGTARDLLLAWDGDIAADRPEPLIFNAWIRRVGRLALAAGGVPAGAPGRPQSGFLRRVLAPDGQRRRLVPRRLPRRWRPGRWPRPWRSSARRGRRTPPPGAGAGCMSPASSTRCCASCPGSAR